MPGTIKAHPNFDPENASKRLMKAMKGLGTNEMAIIEVLTEHDNKQRQQIKAYYKTAYGKDLDKELKSELSGNLETVCLGLLMTSLEWDVYWLHRAVKGLGTNESMLIEVLVGRDFQELEDLKAEYKKKHGKDLDKVLDSELSGDFCRLVRGIVAAGGEAAAPVDAGRAEHDATELRKAAKGLGTDEITFISILNTRSFPQLRATFDAFLRLTGKTIQDTIKSEFSGNMKEALLALVQRVQNVPEYFADRLYYAMKGAGTNDNTLVRIIVGRSEVDLVDIKAIFQHKYGKALSHEVKSETSGDCRKILLHILRD